jgi:hypothetical protein
MHGKFIVNGAWNGDRTLCITFDCDKAEDMNSVRPLLPLLRERSIPTGFALYGKMADRYPKVVEEILRSGHEVINHSFTHISFRSLEPSRIKTEIVSFQEQMKERFAYAVRGFRAPHLLWKYDRSLFRILRENVLYDSSYVGSGVAIIDGTIEIPLTPCPLHPLVCFDFAHHFQFPLVRSSFSNFLLLWQRLLKNNDFVNVYLDPRLVMDGSLEKILSRIPEGWEFETLGNVARRFGSAVS